MHLEPIIIGGETKEQEQYLPCRFYDMPGLDDDQTVTEDEIMKIINNNTNEVKTLFHSFKLLLILINKFLKPKATFKMHRRQLSFSSSLSVNHYYGII